MDYNIPSKPTEYNRRLYRSRLEARWAAMFDLLKWNFEYEPYDLEGWSPDFLLEGHRGDILVEVKPIASFDYELFSRYRSKYPKGIFMMLGRDLIKDSSGMVGLGWFTGMDNCIPDVDHSSNEVYTACLKMQDDHNYGISSGYEEGCHSWFDILNPKVSTDTFIGEDRANKLWTIAANKVMFLKPDSND